MNKLILSALVCCLPSVAFASDDKFGVDILNSFSPVACDTADVEVTNPLWYKTCDKSAVGYRLSYAFIVKPTHRFEIAYVNFGNVEWSGYFTGFPNEPVKSVIDNKAVTFGATAIEVLGRRDFELTAGWNLNAYAGLSSMKGKYDSSEYREHLSVPGSGWTERITWSESSISPILGVGVSYEQFVIALKLHTKVDTGLADKSNILSLGLGARF